MFSQCSISSALVQKFEATKSRLEQTDSLSVRRTLSIVLEIVLIGFWIEISQPAINETEDGFAQLSNLISACESTLQTGSRLLCTSSSELLLITISRRYQEMFWIGHQQVTTWLLPTLFTFFTWNWQRTEYCKYFAQTKRQIDLIIVMHLARQNAVSSVMCKQALLLFIRSVFASIHNKIGLFSIVR